MSRINNQFSVGVHIMTALGDHHDEPVTSAHLTASVRAHESQVRTVLSKLVKAGLVVASRGRNGFSWLSRPANKTSLLEIYKAVEALQFFRFTSIRRKRRAERAALIKKRWQNCWRTHSERLRPGWASECFLRWSQKRGATRSSLSNVWLDMTLEKQNGRNYAPACNFRNAERISWTKMSGC
jgi:DNA-binding IscR family transcriptional regulator